MSLYIDIKYLGMISHQLDLFRQKSQYLWNCRCPICGDSSRKKNRARGYFYRQTNDVFYKCHNCEASQHFGTFLKQFNSNLYREYALERYANGENRRAHSNPEDQLKAMFTEPKFSFDEEEPAPTLLDELLPCVDSLPEDHLARKFCEDRRIPKYQLNRLYFIDDMRNIAQLSDKMRDKIKTSEPRLVLPFRDRTGKLVGVTCRALQGESLRYITVRIDDDAPQIFGWENINPLTTVYAVEGPIDSLFLPNAVAVGGTGFHRLANLGVDARRLTVVIDNQPRNREVVEVYRRVIDAGHRVFIWPNRFDGCKDINDVVLANPDLSQRRLAEIVDDNAFVGLRAQAQFNVWKRV